MHGRPTSIIAHLTILFLSYAGRTSGEEPAHWPPARSVEVEASAPVLEPSYGAAPAMASDGSGFMVVWSARDASSTAVGRATRIDGEGEILDPVGVPLTDAFPDFEPSSVVFGSTMYLVVEAYGPTVRGTGISPDGSVRFRARKLSTGPLQVFDPKVVWSEGEFLVLTSSDWNPPGLAVVNGDGEPVAYHDLDLGFQPAGKLSFAATSDRVVVVGERMVLENGTAVRRELVAVSFARSGLKAVPPRVVDDLAANEPGMPAITSAGGRLIVAWNNDGLRLASLSPDLDVLAEAGIDTAGADAVLPSVVSDGHGASVSWASRNHPDDLYDYSATAYVARVSDDLSVDGSRDVLGPVDLDAPQVALAAGGGRVAACWSHNRRLLEWTIGASGAPKLISLSARRQSSPKLAAGRHAYAVVWEETSAGYYGPFSDTTSVRLQVVSPSGARWRDDSLVLSADGFAPAVAAADDVFAAAWVDNAAKSVIVRVLRVDDAPGVAVALPPGFPTSLHLEWDGSAFVLVLVRSSDAYVTRISAEGSVLGSFKFDVEDLRGGYQGYDLACMTSGLCTFAWTGSQYGNEIHAVRFDALGPLDPAPLLLAKGSGKVNVHAAASPDAFLVAYRDVTSRNPEDNEIRVVTLGRDGAPGTTPVENGQLIFTDFVFPGDVVWWVDQWLLTWTDQPEGLISPIQPDKPGISAFPFGQSWDPSTVVRDGRSFGIASVVRTSDSRRGVSQRIVVRLFEEAKRGRGIRPGSGDGAGKVAE